MKLVAIPLALGMGLSAQPVLCGPALAQKRPVDLEVLRQRDKELESIRNAQKRSVEEEAKLRRQIDEIGDDRRKLNEQLIGTAARVREIEEHISQTQDRLGPLDGRERMLRGSLEEQRTVIADVLAALQRMGRRPPPALLVRPEDALQSVRAAIMLGAVLPEMREQAEALIADLTELANVRKQIAEQRERLGKDLAAIGDERDRLSLLVQQRQAKMAETERALEDGRRKAAALAQQAGSVTDLILKLEAGLDATTRAARAAARAEAERAALDSRPDLAALKDPGRLGPAVAFAAAKAMLPLPVNGVRLREFGAPDGLGGSEKGLSIATRESAQVTSPCDGWVVYAGPYRNYGQLLILNAGGGYHVLLAGMARISVDLGQFVLTGEPVAVMGTGARAAAIATGSSQPVLYIEFRKDGVPVDPSPWWVTSEAEKVRG